MNRIFLFCCLFVFPFSHAEEITFKHKKNSLSGHYLDATNGKPAKAVLLFVHGDGAMHYDAEGYYNLIWAPLRKNGYAIFSWDKPNVGNSSGNWLDQSMVDRQFEVLAAIEWVQNKYHFTPRNTGLVGFSQAGWVLPALANNTSKIGFIVGIGFAANWIEQGKYYTSTKHQLAGKNKNQITAALDYYAKEIAFFQTSVSYSQYLNFAGEEAMTKKRYQFVLKNFRSDASHDYSKIEIPSLFLWGVNDLNVDAKHEFEWWQTNNNKFVATKMIPNASHGMLNAESFDTQGFGVKQWIKLMWLGPEALAPQFLPTMLTWLEQRKL
jgi:pimeloyl-ACP methyl ester carboxylesterase